ncbi:MAG: hypothetical protein P8X98_07835, partial [Woeseiaceae bacterium]
MPRPRLRLRLAALAAAVCLGGCGPSPGPTQPDVPVIDTAQMRGVARDQVEMAYADAAAHPEDIVSVAELALVLHAFVLQTLGDYDGATAQYRSMTGDAQFGARGWARIADLRLD